MTDRPQMPFLYLMLWALAIASYVGLLVNLRTIRRNRDEACVFARRVAFTLHQPTAIPKHCVGQP